LIALVEFLGLDFRVGDGDGDGDGDGVFKIGDSSVGFSKRFFVGREPYRFRFLILGDVAAFILILPIPVTLVAVLLLGGVVVVVVVVVVVIVEVEEVSDCKSRGGGGDCSSFFSSWGFWFDFSGTSMLFISIFCNVLSI